MSRTIDVTSRGTSLSGAEPTRTSERPRAAAGSDGLFYRVAVTREELAGAFRLVQDAYVRAGLADQLSGMMRVTPYHVLETTDVFVAVHRSEFGEENVVATVSLVRDGELGMPLECVYGAEVERLRASGLRLAEVTCFADRRTDARRFLTTFCELNKQLVRCARHHRVDQLLAAVHPRHAKFYERYVGFESFGRETSYPTVCNQPAVAMVLDFERIDREQPRCFQRLFADTFTWPEHVEAARSERAWFARLVDPLLAIAPCGSE